MAEPLAERLDALDAAVGLAEGRLADPAVLAAAEATARARERLERGAEAVVVALAGGTGSGKSSLFNALAGADLSRVGPVRPVTADVTAWAVGDPEATAGVLDWLGVRRRHVARRTTMPDGLVLLDLPDQDSIAVDHRQTADRFVQRVDALLWVVDPLKYAQRSLHDVYLRRLAEHAEVVVFVLNRVDTIGDDARAAILADLRRLLAEHGLERALVVATSARTGEGLDQLRSAVTDLVRTKRAVAERIDADLRTAASGMTAEVGEPRTVELHADRLVVALAEAAGASQLADAGARTYRQDADDATRPLITGAALSRLRRLRRPLRLRRGPAAPAVGREPSPVSVRHALSDLATRTSEGLPHPWPARLQVAAAEVASTMPEAVAKAVDRVPVHDVRRRWWWPVPKVVATAVEATFLAGVVWLCLLAFLAWLRVPEPPTPQFRDIPLPTLMTLGGLVVLAIGGVVRRRLVAAGARRHRAGVRRRVRAAIAEVAEDRALGRFRSELDAHNELVRLLSMAAGRPQGTGWHTSGP